MTLKQGEEINHKFSNLGDSIQKLNSSIIKNNSDIKVLVQEKQNVNNTLIMTSEKLIVSENEITRLKNELIFQEKDHWNQKKSWAGWMFFSFMVTIMVAALK